MNEIELSVLEKTWNEVAPNFPGVIIASQYPAPPGTDACDEVILSTWSAMPVLNKKQKTV
jgi:hypothetical protein